MRRTAPRLLFSLAAASLAACASQPRPAVEVETVVRSGPRCAFLQDPQDDSDCKPADFLEDQVDRLVRGLEADPLWGDLVSPELKAEGRTVVVANVLPSLDYLTREEELSSDLRALVSGVTRSLANRLFSRTLTLAGPDGSPSQASFQEGQLKGESVNEYMEYLAQVGQADGALPFFPSYDEVKIRGRAARTGLLWLVSAREENDGKLTVEFRIKTFEMERSSDGKVLAVRGQLADRTGQLLGSIYTTWSEGRVARYEPPSRSPLPAGPIDARGLALAEPELEETALGPSPEERPPAPTPTEATTSAPDRPEGTRPGAKVLWMTVARLRPSPEGPALDFSPGPLPGRNERFALVFINEHPESFAYIFGPSVRVGNAGYAVPVASDESDRSAVAPAYRREAVSVAMSSVFAAGPEEGPQLLVLRRNQPWSFEEQGQTQWLCRPDSTYRFEELPSTRHEGQLAVGGWVQEELAKLLEVSVRGPAVVDAQDFLTVPLDNIPGDGRGDAMCIVLPFAPASMEGDA